MSEAEKKRRLAYKQNRKKWILAQVAILIVVLLFTAVSFGYYTSLNKTLYINYEEESNIDYKVRLKDNDFYTEEEIGMDKSYVTALVDKFLINFDYFLTMATDSVDFEYKYSVVAVTEVVDRITGAVIYSPKDEIVKETVESKTGYNLNINKDVEIDFHKYNNQAKTFIEAYKLTNVESTLRVEMAVDVKGASEQFSEDSSNKFVFAFNAPLVQQTVYVTATSTVPQTENVILARAEKGPQEALKIMSIAGGATLVVCVIVLFAFTYLTRNTDINYEIQVNRIVKNYKSFIQKIVNPFDDSGYQVLKVEKFGEMLEIRDTISSPVLMFENGDKTCTQFIVPTNTKIIYYFEIKVADYDDIYNGGATESILSSQNKKEEVAVSQDVASTAVTSVQVEPVIEELKEEPVEIEEPILVAEEEIADDVVDECEVDDECADGEQTAGTGDGEEVLRKYRYTFEARLIQTENDNKDFYSQIKNELLSYKKMRAKTSSNYEAFYAGRSHFAKVNVKGKTLYLYLALDAKEYEDSKYFAKDVSSVARYKEVPARFKVKSERGVKYAKELIAIVSEKLGLVKNNKYVESDFAPQYLSTPTLIKRGLIKVIDEHGKENLPVKAQTKYRYSYLGRLIKTTPEIKEYYSSIKNEFMSYKKVREKTSSNYEAFYVGREHLAKVNVRGKTLYLYLALDPKEYENSKYFPTDCSAVSRFKEVPMRIKVRSERGVKYAKELIAVIAEKYSLEKDQNYTAVNYAPENQTEASMLKKGIIKSATKSAYSK